MEVHVGPYIDLQAAFWWCEKRIQSCAVTPKGMEEEDTWHRFDLLVGDACTQFSKRCMHLWAQAWEGECFLFHAGNIWDIQVFATWVYHICATIQNKCHLSIVVYWITLIYFSKMCEYRAMGTLSLTLLFYNIWEHRTYPLQHRFPYSI